MLELIIDETGSSQAYFGENFENMINSEFSEAEEIKVGSHFFDYKVYFLSNYNTLLIKDQGFLDNEPNMPYSMISQMSAIIKLYSSDADITKVRNSMENYARKFKPSFEELTLRLKHLWKYRDKPNLLDCPIDKKKLEDTFDYFDKYEGNAKNQLKCKIILFENHR